MMMMMMARTRFMVAQCAGLASPCVRQGRLLRVLVQGLLAPAAAAAVVVALCVKSFAFRRLLRFSVHPQNKHI
jgi:hypothetical protein